MVTVIVGLVLLAAPAVAVAQNQLPATRAASPVSQEALRLRYEIRVMERVLEQAVQLGVQVVDQQMQSLIPMDVVHRAGAGAGIQARRVRLLL